MLAIVNTPGGTAPVELRDVPEPEPAHTEALVEVRAFSLNRGELRSFRNNEGGWIPGQDVAGVVLRQAASGEGPPAGARVVALVDEFGWAQRVAVPSHRLAVLPDAVSFAAAATLPVAGLTALRTLRHGGPLIGRRVLITGAAGGVGTLAIQIAARSGARVTAVVGGGEPCSGSAGAWCDGRGGGDRQCSGALCIDPGIGRRSVAGAGDPARRGQGERSWCTAIRQASRRPSALAISGARRMPGCRASVILPLKPRSGSRRICAAGVTDRGGVAETTHRGGTVLARDRSGGGAVARTAGCRQGGAAGRCGIAALAFSPACFAGDDTLLCQGCQGGGQDCRTTPRQRR